MSKLIEGAQYIIEADQHIADSYDGIPVSTVPSLGDIVKAGRQRHNMTQTEFAQQTGCSNADISRVENSITRKPSKDFLKAVSPYTGYSYTQLLPIAGYSVIEQGEEFYNTKLEPINYMKIIHDIYRTDADLLDCLSGLYEFVTLEDATMLKLLLKFMRHISTSGKEVSEKKKESFSSLKVFLSAYLPVLLET